MEGSYAKIDVCISSVRTAKLIGGTALLKVKRSPRAKNHNSRAIEIPLESSLIANGYGLAAARHSTVFPSIDQE